MSKLYAVYGSLRKGLGNHRILGESKFKGEFTTPPNFTMYSLGGFPGVIEKGNTPITLEVYEVEEIDIESRLDILEGYHGKYYGANLYNKETIETPFGEAFIYYFNRENLPYPVVESGDWKKYLNKN